MLYSKRLLSAAFPVIAVSARWRRSIAIALVVMCLATVAGHSVASQQTDDALLLIEQPEQFYRQMPVVARTLNWPLIEVREREAIPALARHGGEIAEQLYDVNKTMAQIRDGLKTVDDAVDHDRLPGIASRLRAADDAFAALSFEALQAKDREIQAKVDGRPDKAVIARLAQSMAAPAFGGETVLTAQRFKWVYEAHIAGSMKELSQLSHDELDAGVSSIITTTRSTANVDQRIPLLQPSFRESALRMRRQAILSEMPAQDVADLAAFYESAAGRAKLAAMNDVFRRRNDEDGHAVLMKLVEEAQKQQGLAAPDITNPRR